ncbi:MAG: AmmeMemoRadiSam system protein B [Bacillota bacterium]
MGNSTTMHFNRKPILFKSLALGGIIAAMLLMSACALTASANSVSSDPESNTSGLAGAQPAGSGPADAGTQAASLPPGEAASSSGRQSSQGGPGISSLRCIHFNEKDFRNSIALAGDETGGASGAGNAGYPAGSVAGGVVPHHLLAGKMIAQFFRTLSESSPDTIVIIGPNHDRIGMNKLHTSSLDWATAFGILETDRNIAESLVNELGASENTKLMETEHSISSLAPYVKYYMPTTKIVPILLHGNYTLAESEKLGEFLAGIMKNNAGIVVIASVDFSHYLDADTAEKMDKITLDAIISRDAAAISRMGNDNIDSPPSILSLLCIMDEIGAIGPEITAHDNSFGITGGGAECTTSYFTMFFRRP